MLLPILEIISGKDESLVKGLKFSYPLNDRALAEALSEAFQKLNPEAMVFAEDMVKLVKDGFEIAKMTCNTHIEVKHDMGETKVIGFIDVAYHQCSSNAIRNVSSTLKDIMSYGFSERGRGKLSHGNMNQDSRSLPSNPAEWLRKNFWDLRPAYSTIHNDNAIIYCLPNAEGHYPIINAHNGINEENNIFVVLKKYPANFLHRELAKVYCDWYRNKTYIQRIDSPSYDYADLYSKLPYAQICNKNLVKSIKHYRLDSVDGLQTDRYTIDDFDYIQGDTRVYGWYLKGNDIVIRYTHQGKFRVDQVFFPDHYNEIFNNYQFSMGDFITSIVTNKVSKREVREWLGEYKGEPLPADLPYFACIYSYLENMIDQTRLNETMIHCHDQRILRWLIHFEFITKDLKVLPRGFKYCDDHYGTHTGFY